MADLGGHGTLVASMAIGAMYGVAKGANAIAVKVMQENMNGKLSDIGSGIEWSLQAALNSKRPSIINLSIVAPPNQALRMAALASITAGVHFVAAAGNEHTALGPHFAGSGE
jgi:subtilisin family serine protease